MTVSEKDKLIKSYISSVRRHLTVQLMIDGAARGGIVGLTLAFALSVISMFVPFYSMVPVACLLTAMCVLGAVIYAFVKRPDMRRSAHAVDSLGYREAVITAYELSGKEGVFADAVRDEAAIALAAVRPSRDIPFKVNVRHLSLLLLAAVLFSISVQPDTDARLRADMIHEFDKRERMAEEEIDELLSELSDNPDGLTGEELSDLEDICDEARLSLDSAGTTDELRQAVDKLSLKLTDMKTGDGATSDLLENTAKKLAVLSDGMEDPKTYESDRYAKLDGEGDSDGVQEGQAGQKGQEGKEGQDGQNGKGGQEGQGGQGGQNGQTSPENYDEGSHGGGWSTGSEEGISGRSDRMEDITVPTGETGDDENLTGKSNGNDSSYYGRSDSGRAWSGDKVTYTDVSASYKERAYNQVDGGSYPNEMKDKIKKYFDGFE